MAAVIGLSLALGLGSARADDDIPARLHHYYGTQKGYAEVTHDVMAWHKTALNGCVAFASTALRHIGVDIPMDARIDGYKVSRITGAFSRYLSEQLGWTRIDSVDDLRPGDIVFSTDAPCCAGYPNHVMMFDGWSKRDQEIALVVDNQGFRIARPFAPREGSDVDAFHYALRPQPPDAH
jgi:hypothetical protein